VVIPNLLPGVCRGHPLQPCLSIHHAITDDSAPFDRYSKPPCHGVRRLTLASPETTSSRLPIRTRLLITLPRSTIPFPGASSGPSVGIATASTDIAQHKIVARTRCNDIVWCSLRRDERGVVGLITNVTVRRESYNGTGTATTACPAACIYPARARVTSPPFSADAYSKPCPRSCKAARHQVAGSARHQSASYTTQLGRIQPTFALR
jgi:hypothetical protein